VILKTADCQAETPSKENLPLPLERQFQCIPDGKVYPIPELETRLNFNYLPHNAFETPADRQEIREKGIVQRKNNEVSVESQELGTKFIRKIEAEYIPHVSIRWIDESIGYGLFAEEDLEAGCYVGEYTGIVRKNGKKYFEPLNNYCYEYPVPDEIGRSYVIDAIQGNLTRFINHSFHPNLKPIHAFYEDFYHLIFLAIHRIEKNSQLSYNYGQNYWHLRDKPACL
jgi:uncharacterized protein